MTGAGRVPSVLHRLLGAPRRHPMLADSLLVGLLLVLAAPTAVLRAAPVGVPLSLGFVLPLLWRRRWPVAVFVAVSVVGLADVIVNAHQFAAVALLVAFYTVASRVADRRLVLAVAGVMELGSLVASLRWSATPADGAATFVLLSGLVTAAGLLGANVRTRRAYLAALEDRARRLEVERDSQARLAAAGERARISREMHDIVAHSLTVMVALADGAARSAAADSPRAAEVMRTVSATGRQALAETRRLLGVLRDPGPEPPSAALAPQPGFAELDELVRQVRAAGLAVDLRVHAGLPELPPGAQLAVYRLVQEALTNVLKHAGPGARAAVDVHFRAGRVEVDVVDDGPPAASPVGAGHGLTGMRERVGLYGGVVEAGPGPDRGWQVRAALPAPTDGALA